MKKILSTIVYILFFLFTVGNGIAGIIDLTSTFYEAHSPVWSPDGTKIAFLGRETSSSKTEAYTINPDGSGLTKVISTDCTQILSIDFDPTGEKYYYSEDCGVWYLRKRNIDGSGSTETIGSGEIRRVSFSPTGNQLSYIYYDDILKIMNIDGSSKTSIYSSTNNLGQCTYASWGINNKIIFQKKSGTGIWNCYVINPDGTGLTQITDDSFGNCEEPVFSPDSTKIAYSNYSNSPEISDILVMDAEGSNPIKLTDGQGKNYTPFWSPDSKKIAFTSTRTGKSTVSVVDVVSAAPSFPDDTMSPTGAIHAYPNIISPPNNKLVKVTLDGYVKDELSIVRDKGGIGVSSAYLIVNDKKIILRDATTDTDLLSENGSFSITTKVKAVKGAIYNIELYATDTEPEETGGPNSGVVDSTYIKVPRK